MFDAPNPSAAPSAEPVTTFPSAQPVAAAVAAAPASVEAVAPVPVDVRNTALVFLSLAVALFLLHWASAVFIPVMLGLLCSYALTPMVDRLERWHVPRALGAGVLLLLLIGAIGGGAYVLRDDASRLVTALPEAVQKVKVATDREKRAAKVVAPSTLESVQKAAEQLVQVTSGDASSTTTTTTRITQVQVAPARFNIKDYLWTGTMGLARVAGQGIVTLFMTFFLLTAGDTFRRKLVRVAGNTLAQRKITVQALNEITEQIQRYLLLHLAISALVGVVTGLCLWAVGLENAALWGVVGAVFRLVPYVGSAVAAGGAALVAFLQFGSVNMALAVLLLSVAIHSIAGTLITPWLASRNSRLNPVAIFVGVIAWGWLWGVWGLLLGVPILMAVKAVCDRIDDLKPLGEFLGN
ncbi:AI-2E family transporter [Variovorax sp. HJSM1_2]|uniref:AI-2E family transporter n=1 Tax=Variovorax sp. HJSM1_2 TaxID=3366263 RepID=UPI003BE915A2